MGSFKIGTRRPQGYFQLSRTLTYSLIAVIPLFVLYEVGAWIINDGSAYGVRNAADVTLKEPFLLMGRYAPHVLCATLLLCILAVYRLETIPRRIRIVNGYFPLMLGESLLYATLFGGVINFLLRSLLRITTLAPGMASLDLTSRFVLSLGAGLYEEILFRVLLVSAIFLLLREASGLTDVPAYAAAALLGAFLFSAYHYVGSMGDTFTLHSFLYRFLAGLVLNILYLVRGFGVTAYTHAFYDLLVTVVLPA